MTRDDATEKEVLAELIEDAPCGIAVTDPDGRILYVNGTLQRWLGASVRTRGTKLPDLLTLPGRLFYETHLAPMMRLQGFVREISCSFKDDEGKPFPVMLSGVARTDEAGTLQRFDYTIFDARERRLYEDELRDARRKADELAAIVRSSPNAILRVDPQGRIVTWNKGSEPLFDTDPGNVKGRPVQEIIAFADRPAWFDAAVAGSAGADEVIFTAAHGPERDYEVTLAPIEEHRRIDEPHSWSVIIRDISARTRAERLLNLTMDEMKHRVKNTLAVVAGIARQTLPDGVRDRFLSRLHALGRAHDTLTPAGLDHSDLRDLLIASAEEAGGQDRFRISGDDPVLLTPQQATSLSMALHELTTNALKYGALSTPGGHVEIGYPRDAGGPVRLVWQEHGGPRVESPSRSGFGTKMIEVVIRSELSAEVDMTYAPDGLRCEIAFTPSDIPETPA